MNVPLDSELCEDCLYGKAHFLKFGSRDRALNIYPDVCGLKEKSGVDYR